MSYENFSAVCPTCKGRLQMRTLPTPTPGLEWVGVCPSDHFIQLRVTTMQHSCAGTLPLDPPEISIKNSKLGRKKK